MNVITISREFGSGGRELGKRLADIPGYTYYDREIEADIAKRLDMDEGYISRSIEQGAVMNIPLHFGRTLASPYMLRQQIDIPVEKQRVLKEIAATSHCVIVGRAADVILAEHKPFKIFVYADMQHKIKRCQSYSAPGENLTPGELKKSIKKMDAKRREYLTMFGVSDWGDKKITIFASTQRGWKLRKLRPILRNMQKNGFKKK